MRSQHVQDNMGIRSSQHAFKKKQVLPNQHGLLLRPGNLFSGWIKEDVVYLDLIKHFNTASHGTLREKLAAHGLDGCTQPGLNTG